MSLTLYFAPGACSFVPHCLLEASGVAYEPTMVKLHKGEQYDAPTRPSTHAAKCLCWWTTGKR